MRNAFSLGVDMWARDGDRAGLLQDAFMNQNRSALTGLH
jgi:hypothetical protein